MPRRRLPLSVRRTPAPAVPRTFPTFPRRPLIAPEAEAHSTLLPPPVGPCRHNHCSTAHVHVSSATATAPGLLNCSVSIVGLGPGEAHASPDRVFPTFHARGAFCQTQMLLLTCRAPEPMRKLAPVCVSIHTVSHVGAIVYDTYGSNAIDNCQQMLKT